MGDRRRDRRGRGRCRAAPGRLLDRVGRPARSLLRGFSSAARRFAASRPSRSCRARLWRPRPPVARRPLPSAARIDHSPREKGKAPSARTVRHRRRPDRARAARAGGSARARAGDRARLPAPARPGGAVDARDRGRACSTATARSSCRSPTGTGSSCAACLREPLLRIGPDGVWVNAASPTAAADKLVSKGGSGWVRLSRGRSIAWHDHRLAPPPAAGPGPPGALRSRSASTAAPRSSAARSGAGRPGGVAVARGTLAFAAAVTAVAVLRRGWRSQLTVGLGAGAGLCALLAVTTFAARDAPNGRIAWLQIVAGAAIGAALAAVLVILRGQRRVHAAGSSAGSPPPRRIGSLPVFWHGVVISALPATPARLVCGLALAGGVGRGRAQLPSGLRRRPRGGCAGDRADRSARARAATRRSSRGRSAPARPTGRRPGAASQTARVPRRPATFAVHLELFANAQGRDRPGRNRRRRCSYPVRTRTPTGIVEVAGGKRRDLGDLFRVWGQPLGAHRLPRSAPHRLGRAYVNGRAVAGPVSAIPLTQDAADRARDRRLRPAAPLVPLPAGRAMSGPAFAPRRARGPARARRLRRRRSRRRCRRSRRRSVYSLADFAPAGTGPGRPSDEGLVRHPRSRTATPLTQFKTGPGPHTGVHLILVADDLSSSSTGIRRSPPTARSPTRSSFPAPGPTG